MNTQIQTGLVACTLMLAVLGTAQAQGVHGSDASQTTSAPYQQPLPAAPAPRPTPIFNIGNTPVGIWAPVPPPYDANANRSGGASPMWDPANGDPP